MIDVVIADHPRCLPGSYAGSDRHRIAVVANALSAPDSVHWLAVGPEARARARRVIAILAAA